jgi:hypothetical protein
MITQFPSAPGPQASVLDSLRPGPGVLLDENGTIVHDWPAGREIPDGWRVSRRLTALDSAAGISDAAAAAPLSIDESFALLPRRFTTGRWRLEGELSGESVGDDFTKVQSLNYLRQLCSELEGIADASRPLPWDANSDYGPEIVRRAAKSASDYLRGWGRASLRNLAASVVPNGGASAFGDRAAADRDPHTAAYDAHAEMKRSISDAWRRS